MLRPITIRFPAAMMAQIEAIQSQRADQPEKGQVVRELVAAGLDINKRKGTHK